MSARWTELRDAVPADAAELARRADQLGYPGDAAGMRERLAAVLPMETHRVVVAESATGLPGWIQVEQRESLPGGPRAEILGLIVDPAARRIGLGRAPAQVADANLPSYRSTTWWIP